MHVPSDSNPQNVFDNHFAIKCPHCQTKANLSAISTPRYELMMRFKPRRVGVVYRCDSCNEPVFLRFAVIDYSNPIQIADQFEEIQRPTETFEFQYLPEDVRADFQEALTSYSHSCFNAFAAMCRRCLQSASTELGAEGTAKVEAQLNDLLEMGVVDVEAHAQLKEIMLAGHDGAHPHLPKLSPQRAAVLLELIKDVLYQLFVRQEKIKEAVELRKQAIAEKKTK